MPAVEIKLNTIAPLLRNARRKTLSRALIHTVVLECVKRTQEYYTELNNKRSPTSRFYAQEGAKGNVREGHMTDTSGEVVVQSYKLAHKYYGGEVRASRARFLAIPLTAAAKLRTPRSYGTGKHSPLFLAKRRRGEGFVLMDKRGSATEPVYALVPRVRHKPHDYALPSAKILKTTAETTAKKFLGV